MENLDGHILLFLENDLFIKWVNSPDHASISYWENWMTEHPGQVTHLLQAKQIALDLAAAETPLNAEALSKNIWSAVNAAIGSQEAVPLFKRSSKPVFYRVAALLAGLLLLVSAAFYFTDKNVKGKTGIESIAATENNVLTRINSTVQNQVVYLVDGTKVTLQPGSSITHTVFLEKDKREVYLDGNAFFEVAKDANRPFYVFANDIVLRVLGTSFNVITNKNNGNITVVVKTGKVSVYKKSNRNKAEYILTPNQQIMYTTQSQSIVKSELDSAHIHLNIKPEGHAINFRFEEMPVAKIFSTLEEGYGIRINYDEKVFSKCIVTTSLTDENFEEKLKVICAAVNANYRIENNVVIIDGGGCK